MIATKINGVDITPYIAYGGLKWTRSDIDAQGTTRDLAGTLHRKRVATKTRLDISCRLLTSAEAKIVLSLIAPEQVTVEYLNPVTGEMRTAQMYSNNFPATFQIIKNGVVYWSGITFPLIEL